MSTPSQKIAAKPHIIQQWQAFGRVKPELLADSVYEEVKKYGITSLQSYVYWSMIEPVKGCLDFSAYDEVVKKIIAHKLKWVPFIILGPNYSIPEWFSDSSQSVFAKCLEHGQECDIQSIWNPFLPEYIEKFIRMIAERYDQNEVIESVLIGISGVWGEAIYPSSDGINRQGHKHSGWWCNDQYARQDFVNYCTQKYVILDNLNKDWGTAYASWDNIDWPIKKINLHQDLLYKVFRKIWHELFALDQPVTRNLEQWYENRLLNRDLKDISGRNHYLTFVRWYMQTMTAYARKWLILTKQFFPGKPVYLVTGGYGDVITGADFAGQAKLAGELNAGVRITNLGSNYAESFSNKSLLSTAAKHYHAAIETEETIETAPDEVVMRVFDYASGDIEGLYFKTLFGIDYGTRVSCTGKSNNCIPLGRPSEVAKNLANNYPYLVNGSRRVEAALLVSADSAALEPGSLNLNLALASNLRSSIDLDIIDDTLVQDNILDDYRFIFSYSHPYGHSLTQDLVLDWVKSGGIYLSCGETASYEQYGEGYRISIPYLKVKAFARTLWPYLCNKDQQYPWAPLYLYGEPGTGIYIMHVDEKLILLNDASKEEEKIVMYKGKLLQRFTLKPKSILITEIAEVDNV